ncbi:UDP-glycosyltransferase UGT5 isoform X3 [Aphis gossypii]|uniref:UDP-glucuronosyltransferase n=1 Tax=Aphis gossypii TaxID=80765 RepID=A0A2D1GSG4_APHGO|nr:UDP-glycosyltransferase UGT5 isoform X3 [Aphis gossypii]ATN96012.1 UDP-glucuronosyl transferase 329A3 [Aphis gossypii]
MVNATVTYYLLVAATVAASYRASAARILGVFPHHGYSHHMVFLPYLRTLADRGHDVHVISNFDSSHPNITDINVVGSMPMSNNNVTFPITAGYFGIVGSLTALFGLSYLARTTEGLFDVPAVQNLLEDRTATFDLVIAEHFNSELPLGFAAKYRAPFVLLSSCPLPPWTMSLVGQPLQIAYRPSMLSGLPERMDLGQRLINTAVTAVSVAVFRLINRSWSQQTLRKRMDLDVSLDELASNVSLVLVNTHWSLNGVSPTVAAVKETGGMHIMPPKQLPIDIQKYIDEAENGVIYFCMGSLLRGETFSPEKRQMFLNVFNKIPQRVLWKWEGELPGKPSNVMIRKWMPQRDILAHPNVKLFISHGGLLGTTEAVYEGVPILSMPIFGDQMTNIKAVVSKGAAEMMNYGDLNEDEIFKKITSMITDPKYRQKAKELSEAFRDRPMSPLETAVYWTEYVIRHKGAPLLRSAAVGMPWYQYYLIDVLVVILLTVTTIFVLLYCLIFKVLLRLLNRKSKQKKS